MSDEVLRALLVEALPIVRAEARYWDEGSSERANVQRQAAAEDLAERIVRALG